MVPAIVLHETRLARRRARRSAAAGAAPPSPRQGPHRTSVRVPRDPPSARPAGTQTLPALSAPPAPRATPPSAIPQAPPASPARPAGSDAPPLPDHVVVVSPGHFSPTRFDCDWGRCEVANLSALHHPLTRGVIWYGPEVSNRDPAPPVPRLPHHRWVLYNDESPCTYDWMLYNRCLAHFNISAGLLQATSIAPQAASHIGIDAATILTTPALPLGDKNALRARGHAPVLYIQSNCYARIGRDAYVRELMKFVAVDAYGGCLHNRDLPADIAPWHQHASPEFLRYAAGYKFTIAWENCACDDYVTEKLMRALVVGSVPLYSGARNWRDWAPDPAAAVPIDEFAGPAALAAHVLALDRDDAAYERHLAFKRPAWPGAAEYQRRMERLTARAFRTGGRSRGMCAVCDALRGPAEGGRVLSPDDMRCSGAVDRTWLQRRWDKHCAKGEALTRWDL